MRDSAVPVPRAGFIGAFMPLANCARGSGDPHDSRSGDRRYVFTDKFLCLRGWLWGRQDAELAHQAESIHDDAGVLDAAILEAVDDNSPDENRTTCCGNAEEFTAVGTGPFEAAGDFIVLRDLFLDGEDDIGKAGTHGAKDVFQTVESGTLPRHWDLLSHVFPDILLCRFDVSLGDDFIYKAAYDSCIVSRHSFSF
ncbi:MAG: hypothetical protein P4L51_19890 [Puia sp.]|nr:hypothetical protein [Puia sp.]